jgi:CP family cyanate transporter-like MFS transporter
MGFAAVLGLTAMNLRPAITSLPPLMPEVTRAYGLSAAAGSVLIALPVFVLGAGTPLGPMLARRLGGARAVALALLLISFGVAIRSVSVAAMFPGTAVAAIGITIIAVLLPGIVKSRGQSLAGLWTAVYGLSMALGAALAPAASGLLDRAGVPLKQSLLIWAVLPLAACWCWLATVTVEDTEPPRGRGLAWLVLARSPHAWGLTVFFALQAMLFFLVVTWLPQFYRGNGGSATDAGLALALFSGIGMLDSWFVPQLASRPRARIPLALALSLLGVVGFVLLAVGAPTVLAVLCLGVGQAGVFPLALMLFTTRASDVRTAEALSAMAQGVGFVAAAVGLIAVAFIHTRVASWQALWIGLAVIAVLQAVVGCVAASSRVLSLAPPS